MVGKMLILSAPSGSGKTTLVKHLLDTRSDLAFSISATTRHPRGNEKHGVDYYFLSVDEFEAHISNSDFVEYEEVYSGRYYGTLKSEVQRIHDSGKHVVFDIDVQGGKTLKQHFSSHSLAVFIKPPSVEELRNRLISRNTDSSEDIAIRIEKAKHELTMAPFFDVVLINDDLDESKLELEILVTNFLAS